MDAPQFEQLARSLTNIPSRRGLLSGLVATLGLAAIPVPSTVAAKNRKRKKRNKKVKALTFNAFGCVNVGQACRGDSANCCSGICQGKKPKKGQKDKSRCISHDAGSCQAGQDICSGVQAACGGDVNCFQTTGKASFCGEVGECVGCRKDSDCETEFGPGAACIVCASLCQATGGAFCAAAAA